MKKVKPPRYFVVSGGASHGTTLWGAVRAGLESFTPVGWAGASIGAVIAAGMALGLDQEYLEQQMVKLFQKNRLTGGRKVIRLHPKLLTRASGMHDWTHVQKALKDIFKDAKMGDVKTPLCIVVGDVYTSTPRYITSWKNPNVLIWEALSASTAVWPAAAAQEIPSLGTGNRLYVDGGWGNNCPHEVFADREDPTLTFYLAKQDRDQDGEPDPVKREGLLGILEACLELSLYVEPNIRARADDLAIPIIPSGSGLDFDLSATEIRRRVLSGYAQARFKLRNANNVLQKG